MNVLSLIPYIPTPPDFGGALRIFHILKHLHDHHEVTVAGFGTNGDLEKFYEQFPGLKGKIHVLRRPWRQKLSRLLQLYSCFTNHSYWHARVSSGTLQRMIDSLVSEYDFDVIQFEFPSMGFFDFKCDAVTILDAHNVEYDNFRRMADMNSSHLRRLFYQREYEKFYKEEIGVCRRQDAIFTTSDRDLKLLNRDVPQVPKFVIPNGVDLSYFHPCGQTPEPASLVFTGMMGYVPNYEGILYFLDEIFPHIKKKVEEAKIYIVGKNPPDILTERAADDVVVTGYVEDVRPFVWRSSVYVVPLRMGGGTRLKVLEALAMKKPVVTTGIGCEGIDVKDGETVLINDSPEAFAGSVVKLLREQQLGQRLSRNGYDLVRSNYCWDAIGARIEDAYSKILGTSEKKIKKRYERV